MGREVIQIHTHHIITRHDAIPKPLNNTHVCTYLQKRREPLLGPIHAAGVDTHETAFLVKRATLDVVLGDEQAGEDCVCDGIAKLGGQYK